MHLVSQTPTQRHWDSLKAYLQPYKLPIIACNCQDILNLEGIEYQKWADMLSQGTEKLDLKPNTKVKLTNPI